MLKKFTLIDPFNSNKTDKLSDVALREWVGFLNLSASKANGKINVQKTFETEFFEYHMEFVLLGLITIDDVADVHIKINDKLKLSKEEYDKLCGKYNEPAVKTAIENIRNSKYINRYTNLYRTIHNWIPESEKTSMSKEQYEWAEKSYNIYKSRTGCPHCNKTKYFNILEELFKSGYELDMKTTDKTHIRGWMKHKLLEEEQKSEKKFVKAPHTIVQDFLDVQKFKKVGG